MSGNDDAQDEMDDELEQEQMEMQQQEKTLKTRQDEIKQAETTNLKREQGVGQVAASMTDDEDDEETLG